MYFLIKYSPLSYICQLILLLDILFIVYNCHILAGSYMMSQTMEFILRTRNTGRNQEQEENQSTK